MRSTFSFPGLAWRDTGGTGSDAPLAVCLHSSTGSQSQWRPLAERLAGRWRVVAPDLHGHGHSPAWPAGAPNALDVDAGAVEALVNSLRPGTVPGGLHLVGHSYGAAVALRFALRHPQRVRSLVLYEPVLFGLLARCAPADAALAEIEDIAGTAAALVRAGEHSAAAQVFACYWGGANAWRLLDEAQRKTLAHRVATVPRHFDALFAAAWPPRLLRRLAGVPIVLLHGSRTRAPTRRIAELLCTALPQVRARRVEGAGHLGPITAADEVAGLFAGALDPALADAPLTADA